MPKPTNNNTDQNKKQNDFLKSFNTPQKWAKRSFSFGIFGILCNVVCCMPDGIPVSIVLGVFGISFALISKQNSKNQKFTHMSLAGFILSIVAIFLGTIMFLVIINIFDSLKDPATGNYYLHYAEDLLNSVPENTQDLIKNLFGTY